MVHEAVAVLKKALTFGPIGVSKPQGSSCLIQILHDLIYQNPKSSGTVVCMGSRRICSINRLLRLCVCLTFDRFEQVGWHQKRQMFRVVPHVHESKCNVKWH